MEYYYKDNNPFYKPSPKFKDACLGEIKNAMKFIYPTEKSSIFLPKNFDGEKNELVLKVAHSSKESTLFWYVDKLFLGTTQEKHEFAVRLKTGDYIISVTDNFGNEMQQQITIKE